MNGKGVSISKSRRTENQKEPLGGGGAIKNNMNGNGVNINKSRGTEK